MTDEIHPTVPAMWYSFIAENTAHLHDSMPDFFNFGTNKSEADTSAMLIKAGLKTASSGALASYLNYEVPIPVVGNLAIITNWDGEAQCIIKTTKVDLVPFDEVTEEYAMLEGEGDQTLKHWQKSHWDFFVEDLANFGETPTKDMMVVCEQFEMVYSFEEE